MAGTGTDTQTIVFVKRDRVKVRDACDTYDDFGHQEPLAHPDNQRGSAGDDASAVAVLVKQREGFVQARRL